MIPNDSISPVKPREHFVDKMRIATRLAAVGFIYAAIGQKNNIAKIAISDGGEARLTNINYFEPSMDIRINKFNMLMCLAGREAELLKFGNAMVDSGSDYKAWHVLAKHYLNNGEFGMYFPNPENSFEHNENRELLENLMLEQKSVIFEYLSENKEVLEMLSATLISKGRLDQLDLEAAFKKAIIPHNFP